MKKGLLKRAKQVHEDSFDEDWSPRPIENVPFIEACHVSHAPYADIEWKKAMGWQQLDVPFNPMPADFCFPEVRKVFARYWRPAELDEVLRSLKKDEVIVRVVADDYLASPYAWQGTIKTALIGQVVSIFHDIYKLKESEMCLHGYGDLSFAYILFSSTPDNGADLTFCAIMDS